MKSKVIYQYIKSHIQSGAYDMNGVELFIACPGCGNETHFSVNIKIGKFNCFKCDIGGSLISEIINDKLGWSRLTKNLLSQDFIGNKSSENKIELPKISFNIYKTLYPDGSETKKHVCNSLRLCKKAFTYCVKRGLTNEQIKEYKLYIIPNDPRVYFPYWNQYGEITYYMGRKIMGDDDSLKTKDADNTEKPLFGRHVKVLQDFVVLLEGAFDHFVTPNSYSLMGSSINHEQIIQLGEDGIDRIYIIGDPDASKSVIRQAKKLRNFRLNAFPVFLHSEQDPAELGREKMYSVVSELYNRNDKIYQPIHVGFN